MNDQAAPVFVIEDSVAIPARTIPNAGPRESKYPVGELNVGQGFAIPVKDEKESRQKQSQMSSLARSRNIKLQTRFFSGEDGNVSPFKSTPAPCLGVWRVEGTATKRTPKAKTDPAPVAPAPEAPAAPAAPAAPSAPAAPDAEVMEL